MNEKIGYRETAVAVSMFSLSPAVLLLVANLSSAMNAGAWINFVINSFYVLIALRVLKSYFVTFDSDIIDSAFKTCGITAAKITGTIYLMFVFLYTAFNFGLYTDSISKLGFFSYSEEYISFLPAFAAITGAYLGIEGNTRTSYTISFVVLIILFFCILSTSKAWDTENFFPFIGTNGTQTFLSLGSIAAYPGLSALFVVSNRIGENSKALKCVYRCFATVFLVTLSIIVIYILSVPYPINRLYKFSAEGLFSSTLSGELFHRFEIFLISLCILLDIATTSFGILLCATLAAKLTGSADSRPYVLIFGVIIFCFEFLKQAHEIYLVFCSVMTAVTLAIPIILMILYKLKGRVKK